MDRRVFLAGAVALGSLAAGNAWAEAPTAAATIAAESAKAAAAGKRLLVVFHADWCVYCRLMDAMLKDPKAAAIVDRYYVTLHVRALERTPETQKLQLAGADELYASYAKKGAGLPYTLVLGEGAAKVTDSIMASGDNFGFPVTGPELDGFEVMMKAGAPAMTAKEARALRKACVAVMKKT